MASKVILISGGTASGKSSIAKELTEILREKNTVTRIELDNYYRPKIKNLEKYPEWDRVDWDDPKSLDWVMLKRDINILLSGTDVEKPLWSYETNDYKEKTKTFKAADIIIIEGIFGLNKRIVDLGDFKIFVHASDSTRIERRIERDKNDRYENYDSNKFRSQWVKILRPAHEMYIEPTRTDADFIIDTELIKIKYISETLRSMIKYEFNKK